MRSCHVPFQSYYPFVVHFCIWTPLDDYQPIDRNVSGVSDGVLIRLPNDESKHPDLSFTKKHGLYA